jgi:4-hydroxy-tetrahydrodipicolinate synthase
VNVVFRGVGVALVTLFDEQLEVDVAATVSHASQLVELGVSAVVVAGTTGEAASLSAEERVALVSATRAALPGRVPVIAGTGAPDGRTSAALTAQAFDAGADAVLVLSPPFAADPRRYYAAVVASSGGLPVLAYHYPAVSPPGIPLHALADLPPEVVGMKDSTGDVDRLLAELEVWDRAVYPGSAALVSTAAALGCPGVILALANAEPDRCVAAWADGRGDGAAQTELTAANRAATAGGFPHGVKSLTTARFATPGWARMGD